MSSSPVGRFNNLTIGSPNRTPTNRTPTNRTPTNRTPTNRTPTNRTPVYSPSAYQSPTDLISGYESTKAHLLHLKNLEN